MDYKDKNEQMEGANVNQSMERGSNIDELLAHPAQQAVARMVADLAMEEPNMTWRSALSGRLVEVARARERKRRFNWIARPALGLGLAGALALAVLWRPTAPSTNGVAATSVEEQIVSAHRDAVNFEQFWSGVRVGDEVRQVSAPAVKDYQWDETDLGTL